MSVYDENIANLLMLVLREILHFKKELLSYTEKHFIISCVSTEHRDTFVVCIEYLSTVQEKGGVFLSFF